MVLGNRSGSLLKVVADVGRVVVGSSVVEVAIMVVVVVVDVDRTI